MTGFNHIATGVVIAVTVRQPVLAPMLAFASHFVLDSLPHFDQAPLMQPGTRSVRYMIVVEIVLMALAILAGVLLFPDWRWLILLCAFLAFLPDIFWGFHKQLKKYRFWRQFFQFHNAIQWGERPWGWSIEAVYFLALVILLTQYKIRVT